MSKRSIPPMFARQTAHYMHEFPGCEPYWTTFADVNTIRIFFRRPNGMAESVLKPRLEEKDLTPVEEKSIVIPEEMKVLTPEINEDYFSNE